MKRSVTDSTENSGKWDRQTMVNWMKKGGQSYVKDQNGVAWCQVRTSSAGTEFLQTVADGRPTDNLLNLLECN